MEPEAITKLTRIKTDVLTLIMTRTPLDDYEIDVQGILISVHQKLNTIKMEKLGQMPLPEPKPPEGQQMTIDEALKAKPPLVECPTCKGAKTVKDGDDNDALCPTCTGTGTVTKTMAEGATRKDAVAPAIGKYENASPEVKKAAGITEKPSIADMNAAAIASAPIHMEKDFIDNILAINSAQSLAEKPPRVVGMFAVDDLLPGKDFVCTGTVWGKDEKDIAALCYEVVEADKYTGQTHTLVTIDEHSYSGLKITYKEKDYVLVGTEYQFVKELPETEKKVKPPRKSGRKSNADKKARTQAIVDNKTE